MQEYSQQPALDCFSLLAAVPLPFVSPASGHLLWVLPVVVQGLSISCRTLHSPQSNIRQVVGNNPLIRHS